MPQPSTRRSPPRIQRPAALLAAAWFGGSFAGSFPGGPGFFGTAYAASSAYVATATEEAALSAGEIALRSLPSSNGRVKVLGIVEIHGTAAATWNVLLDFPGRLPGNSSLRTVESYRPSTATEQWYRFEASRLGYSVVYYNHYTIDKAAGTLIHHLDPDQPSDLPYSHGEYTIAPSPVNPAWTRLTYLVESDFGKAIPGFLQDWMCGGGVRDFLADLMHRAEAGGGP